MRPILLCVLLLPALASIACKTMKTLTLDELRTLGPDRAWVTGSDASVVLMYEPRVVRDTLTGYVGKHREKMPTARVQALRVRRPAPVRTTLLVVGLAAGMTTLLVLSSGSGPVEILTATSGAPGDCDKHPEEPICSGTGSVWSR